MVSMDWNGAISARKIWRSKLASAFQRSSKRKNAYFEALQEHGPDSKQDNTVVIARPTKGAAQIGVPLSQQQSPLFGLPLEIRQIIYEFVFGPSLLHIEPLMDRLAHVKCLKWESSDGWEGHAHCRAGLILGVVKVDTSEDPND
jgi:hypothetical protein